MRTPQRDALSLLGLAMRAGALVVGVASVRRVVEAGGARLVVISNDASAVQLKKLETVVARSGVPVLAFGSGLDLGAAIGRSAVSAVAVTDKSIAGRIVDEFGGSNGREIAALDAVNSD